MVRIKLYTKVVEFCGMCPAAYVKKPCVVGPSWLHCARADRLNQKPYLSGAHWRTIIMNRTAEYTEAVHAERLAKFLTETDWEEVHYCCPASVDFQAGRRFIYEVRFDIHQDPVDTPECIVCKRFVGMPTDVEACPCDYFESSEEAIKITKQKLKEKGYAHVG
jgi:hypothetical protein